MKYVIILPDGAADEPLSELQGKPPLETADTPAMHWIATHGRLGRASTVPDGFVPATDVATLSLFGYAPSRYYTGRAPLEAAAQHLDVTDDQLIFRCNFVTIEQGKMADFTADHIDQSESDQLVADLNTLFSGQGCAFHAGVSYRNLLLLSNAADWELTCQAPHDIAGQSVDQYPPRGKGAERVTEMMDKARELLADHPVNLARRDKGRSLVTDIWLWGQGRPTVLDSFGKRHDVSVAVITGVDIIRGLAVSMGMDLIEVDGATGYLDTNYEGKGQAGVAALDRYDMVVVHVEAPDEAGHEGSAEKKVDAIEKTDRWLVAPLLAAVKEHASWRIMVAPDHPTLVRTKGHSAVPPLVAIAGTGIESDGELPFHDAAALSSPWFVERGHELMDSFME